MAPADENIRVELVWCRGPGLTGVQVMTLRLPTRSSVEAALIATSWWPTHTLLADAGSWGLGVWGRKVSLGDTLKDGDRLEIYRPLTADPKEVRRLRYRAQGQKGRRVRALR